MKQFKAEMIIKKSQFISALRDYFEKSRAVEVFTPYLSKYPNLDPNVQPIECETIKSSGEKIRAFLHTSPEYNMKKLLTEIKQDIFQICHVFRNYEGSDLHTNEFMMIEWYRIGYDLDKLMDDVKQMFLHTAEKILSKTSIKFRGKIYDLSRWEKITVDEAFYRYTGIYPDDRDSIYNFLKNSSIQHTGISPEDYETNFYTVYSFYVEPNLGKDIPAFIYNYPPEFSALARIKDGRGKRFEAYIGGIELVNGYEELTDPVEVEKRLKKEKKNNEKEGKEYPIDFEFIKASSKMPECSGASLGIDRLIMVFLDKKNIQETQVLNWI